MSFFFHFLMHILPFFCFKVDDLIKKAENTWESTHPEEREDILAKYGVALLLEKIKNDPELSEKLFFHLFANPRALEARKKQDQRTKKKKKSTADPFPLPPQQMSASIAPQMGGLATLSSTGPEAPA
jgi:hypothetical protein